MRLNLSDEFLSKLLDGKVEFEDVKVPKWPWQKAFSGIHKMDKIMIELKDGKTVVSLYYKDLFVGDWKMEEVDFKAGATLTIAELDIRMKIHMEGG